MYGYGNSMFLATHGILARSASGGGVDPDAQAVITAIEGTGVTLTTTQKGACNTLVTDLKGYGIWTKQKAIYGFLGGTAAAHKFNWKNPLDTNAAFRILWNGGVTHSSNGVQFGGVNGYGNTNLTPSSALTLNSNHISVYSRTNVAEGKTDFGVQDDSVAGRLIYLQTRSGTSNFVTAITSLDPNRVIVSNTDGRGFYLGSRSSSTSLKGYKNGTLQGTNTTTAIGSQAGSFIALGALNYPLTSQVINYSSKELAFASVGDGLTDTEAANYNTAVQAYQTTLGRSIGTQTVSDADAQAFVTNAGIVDQVEANAINNLVIGLKADGLWSKMKACYPMVGGSSSTMKYNLVNPLDTNAAFRLVFNGGWTFSSNGATPNGTNAYADTFFNPSTSASLNSHSLSYYSRTNATNAAIEIGVGNNNTIIYNILELRTTNTTYFGINSTVATYTDSDSRGFYLANRQASNDLDLWRQGVKVVNGTTASSSLLNGNIYLGAMNSLSLSYPQFYSTKQCAFASIGDGLTDTDAANLYTRVNTFQTALNRNV